MAQTFTADVNTIGGAVQSLLSNTKRSLGVPGASTSGSVTLGYRFSVSSSLTLDADWALFDGFVLNNVTLYTEARAASDVSPEVRVQLAASAMIGGHVFSVRGVIPSITEGKPVDINFELRLRSNLDTWFPDDLLNPLTKDASIWTKAFNGLDAALANQIDTSGRAGVAYTAGLRIQVSQPSAGAAFFLKAMQVDFDATMKWSLMPGQVDLTNLQLGLTVARDRPGGSWNTTFNFDAELSLGLQSVDVYATLQVGEKSSLELGIETLSGGKLQALDLLSRFTASRSELERLMLADAPQNVNRGLDNSGSSDAFSANLFLRKDADRASWYLDHAQLDLALQQMYWHPLGAGAHSSFYLDNLFLLLLAERRGRPSDYPLGYRVIFGGVLVVFGLRLRTAVSYRSATPPENKRYVVLDCTIDDGTRVSLQQIAQDPLLNPSTPEKPMNLAATASAYPVPASAPVNLDWCSLRDYGRDRYCNLKFVNDKLARARLKAAMGVPWQLTSWLQVDNMGIYFDIAYPETENGPSAPAITGYAYGRLRLSSTSSASQLTLFAFLAGMQKATDNFITRDFLLRLSLSAQLDSSDTTSSGGLLGGNMKPADVFPAFDTSFSSDKGIVTDGAWVRPDSFPADAKPSGVFTTVSASMDVVASQKQNGTPAKPEKGFDTSVRAIRASLGIGSSTADSGWEIFSGVKLTGLSMQILAVPEERDKGLSWSYIAQLEGTVVSRWSDQDYIVKLAAMARQEKGLSEAEKARGAGSTQFIASVKVYPKASNGTDEGAEASLLTFLRLPVAGGMTSDPSTDSTALASLPSEITAKPADLLSSGPSTVSCQMHISKSPSNSWTLDKITAAYTQSASSPWNVWDGRIVVTNTRLFFSVTSPRGTSAERQVRFLASATLKIGSLANLTGTVARGQHPKTKQNQLVLRAETGDMATASRALRDLTGQDVRFPADSPSMESREGFVAFVEMVCNQEGGGRYELSSVEIGGTWMAGTTWTIGPFALKQLSVSGKVAGINSVGERTTTVRFDGYATIDKVPLAMGVIYAGSELSVVVSAGLTPSNAVGLFNNRAGLVEGENAPPVSADMGLNSYEAVTNAEIRILFSYDKGWSASKLLATIGSRNKEWVLVKDVLHGTDLLLALEVANLSSRKPKVTVSIQTTFRYKQDDDDPGMSGTMSASLTANMDEMTAELVGKCTLPRFLYVVTAGYLHVPSALDFPLIRLEKMTFVLNWDKGFGKVKVTMEDWKLPKELPDIASMRGPGLEAKISRNGGRLEATASLVGTAIIFEMEFDLTYVLPKGPFLINGIDVRQAIRLVKELYEKLKKIKDVAEAAKDAAKTVAQLAEYEGYADAAAGVVTGLTDLGLAAGIIKAAVDFAFGGKSDSSSSSSSTKGRGKNSDKDDDSSDYDWRKTGKNSWTLGGNLMSPGPGGQRAELFVYPKDPLGFFLPLKLGQVSLSQVSPSEKLSVDWSAVPEGYQGIVTRPTMSGRLVLEYLGMHELSTEFENVVDADGIASAFSLSRSDVIFPERIPYKSQKGEVRLIPRDVLGVARRGPDAAPKDIRVSLVNKDTDGIPPIAGAWGEGGGWVRYNDCLVFPFTLQEEGPHELRITVAGENIVREIVGIRAFSLQNSIFYGSGLCSGPPGEDVFISKLVHDQDDNELKDWKNTPGGLKIFMTVPGESGGGWATTELLRTDVDDSEWWSYYHYKRPQRETSYTITITLNEIPHPDSPITLEVSTDKGSTSPASITPRVSKRRGRPDQKPFEVALGEQFRFEVRTYDGKGRLWYGIPQHFSTGLWQDEHIELDFTKFQGYAKTGWDGSKLAFLRCPIGKVFEVTPRVELIDGTVIKNKETVTLKVVEARALATCTVSGPGLNPVPGARTSLLLQGVDQYGDPLAPEQGETCQLSVAGILSDLKIQQARTNIPGQSRYTYQAPVGDNQFVSVSVHPVGGSTFPEVFQVASTTSQTTIDATESFIVWDNLQADKLSTATLYAKNSRGLRLHTGGDVVEAKSLGPNPIVFPEAIKDNNDGTYTIIMSLPPGAMAPDTASAVASLEVRVNGTLISSTPQSFPLPRGTAVSVASVKMLDATDGDDGRQRLPDVAPFRQPRFRFHCVDVYGQPVNSDVVRENFYVGAYIREPGSNELLSPIGTVLRKGEGGEGDDDTVMWLGFDGSDANGEFLVFMWWRDVAVRGSPFKVKILKGDPE